MASDKQAQALSKIAQLRRSYLAHLPAELTILREQAARWVSGDASVLTDLYQRLHKLAGSGGTFGLFEFGQAARALELKIKGWIEPIAESPTIDMREAFAIDVAGLARLVSRATESPGVALEAKSVVGFDDKVVIWLVDDDQLLSDALVRQLESFNFSVTHFLRLADAEAAAASDSPHILLLDVVFDNEGLNATTAFSKMHHLTRLVCPILFISAADDFTSRICASRLNAAGYFLKPLDVPRLVNRLSQLLSARHAPPPKVLIVDDDQQLAAHYQLTLQSAGMDIRVLERPDVIVDTIAEFQPELVLMDMHMPAYTGPELAGVIRQYDNWASLPIVYLSGETDLDQRVSAMNRGADDYLVKPISGRHLVAAVSSRVERARQLQALISRDSLTGLLKHASIKEAAEIEILRARRNGAAMTLVMVDLDHFKSVNDTYGHAAGDLVISALAVLLRQRLRRADIIGRYGGEEFVLVLPECNGDSAKTLIDDLRNRFAELPFTHNGRMFRCTLSAALASIEDYPEAGNEALFLAADEALYRAKNGGRNQVELAKPVLANNLIQ